MVSINRIKKANRNIIQTELDYYIKGQEINYNLFSSLEIIESNRRTKAISYCLEKLDQGAINRTDLIDIIGYILGYTV